MRRLFGFVLLGALLMLSACVGSPTRVGNGISTYSVSGIIEDEDGNPLEGVILSFEAFGIATTDAQGHWSKSGLSGAVTIRPAKDGWAFTPQSVTVTGSRNDIRFTGRVDASSLDADVIIVEALVDPNPAWAGIYDDRVQLTLENVGGAGYFKVQFWGVRPNVINPPLELFAETEVYEVDPGWSGTYAWDVPTPSDSITTTTIREVVVLSRNRGDLTYRETSRVTPTLTNGL